MWQGDRGGGYRSCMTPTWLDHALVLCFAVLLPLRGATIGYRRLVATGDAADARKRFYRQSLLLHGVMLLATLTAWHVADRRWSQLGLGVGDPWAVLVGFAAAFVALWIHYSQGIAAQRRGDMHAIQAARLGRLAPLMPRTRRELDVFILLLLLAAVSEEILFRGFLTAYLQSYAPLTVAAILSVLVFALGHLYQGAKGVVQTAVIGTLCMIFYLYTGSLWPSIVLHGGLNFVSAHIGHAIVRATPRAQ
jgi:membrane protease YdiL (CAAX protease family)